MKDLLDTDLVTATLSPRKMEKTRMQEALEKLARLDSRFVSNNAHHSVVVE